jgi:hypothetical protein
MITSHRTLAAGLLLASLSLASGRAEAQDSKGFAQQGAFLISADRLFGVYFGKEQTKQDAGNGQTSTSTESHTSIGLGVTQPTNVLQAPRLALDYAVIPNLTVGAGLGYARYSTSLKSESNGVSNERDGATVSGYLLAPRVGYAIAAGPAAIWLRGGLSLGSSKSESTEPKSGIKTTSSSSVTDLSLEPTAAIMLTPSFGLLVGIIVDIPLGGSVKNETSGDATARSTENDYRVTNFGLTFGLIGQL